MISAPVYNPDGHQLLAKLKPATELVYFCSLESDLYSSQESFCAFPISTANMLTGETVSQTIFLAQLRNELADYSFSDFDSIAIFLLDNPEILEAVVQAPAYIYEIFGNEVNLQLNLFINPEEDTKTLNIFILNSLEPNEAFAKEQQLFDVWYETNYADLIGKLNFREIPA